MIEEIEYERLKRLQENINSATFSLQEKYNAYGVDNEITLLIYCSQFAYTVLFNLCESIDRTKADVSYEKELKKLLCELDNMGDKLGYIGEENE